MCVEWLLVLLTALLTLYAYMVYKKEARGPAARRSASRWLRPPVAQVKLIFTERYQNLYASQSHARATIPQPHRRLLYTIFGFVHTHGQGFAHRRASMVIRRRPPPTLAAAQALPPPAPHGPPAHAWQQVKAAAPLTRELLRARGEGRRRGREVEPPRTARPLARCAPAEGRA